MIGRQAAAFTSFLNSASFELASTEEVMLAMPVLRKRVTMHFSLVMRELVVGVTIILSPTRRM
jgi:hypothetical protein